MKEHFLFYAPPESYRYDNVQFPEEEAHHMFKVLRKRPGEMVQVTDGVGHRMDVRLDVVDKKKVTGEVIAKKETPPEPERILMMGVIRHRDRLEFAVEKATEFGATHIVLVHSDHAGKMTIKPSRIDKILISAIKQSRRFRLPKWEKRNSFFEVLSEYRENRKVIMAHPGDHGNQKWKPDDAPSLLMVGPEGGFSDKEVEQAVASGASLVRLGPTRLRTETAVCALMTLSACYGTAVCN